MVRFTMTLDSGRGRAATLAAALRQSMLQTQPDPACLFCSVSTDVTDPATLHYVEEWATEQDFAAQIRSDRFHRLMALMETAATPPRIGVQLVSRSHGFEYIEAAFSGEPT
jgi:quinol monooxygenase YgiN